MTAASPKNLVADAAGRVDPHRHGGGEENALELEFSWVELPASSEFALALDDDVHLLGRQT